MQRVDATKPFAANLVVLPTIVEAQPRMLLRALTAGLPVITTKVSGLHSDCGAIWVESLNSAHLRSLIVHQLGTS